LIILGMLLIPLVFVLIAIVALKTELRDTSGL
jgi:hypothetical protein